MSAFPCHPAVKEHADRLRAELAAPTIDLPVALKILEHWLPYHDKCEMHDQARALVDKYKEKRT